MMWLVLFVAIWCALSLLFSTSAGAEGESGWTVFLAAGTVAAILWCGAFLAYHLLMAVWLYIS